MSNFVARFLSDIDSFPNCIVSRNVENFAEIVNHTIWRSPLFETPLFESALIIFKNEIQVTLVLETNDFRELYLNGNLGPRMEL